MELPAQRQVISGVGKLEFGPPSDIFSQALAIVLSHLGESIGYQEILCTSGRAFKICWSDEMFFWDRFAEQPDPDPEYYLRTDYESVHAAVRAAGYQGEIIANSACERIEQSASIQRREDGRGIRELVLDSIDAGRPVVALMSVAHERWAPEWSIVTGYDEGGDVVTGWSCFQTEEREKEELEFEPEGCFRKRDWERDTPVIVRLSGEKADVDRKALGRDALEFGVTLSPGLSEGHESRGFETYERWACAVEDRDIETLDEEALLGRLHYHIHFIGHLAAQKWYTCAYLKDMEKKGWNVSDVLHAAARYAKIHELMWDCWKLAGGYWRDAQAEVGKFRVPETRREIAAIIREAETLDRAAFTHLGSALGAWDKSHSFYINS